MKAVVLTFARLPVSMLGCYGNLRIRTPHFDRLAAESVVFEQHYAENFAPGAAAHAWETGCYEFSRAPEPRRPGLWLSEAIRKAGVASRLIVEETEETFPLPELDRAVSVSGMDGLHACPEETPFARLVARGVEAVDELQRTGAERWLLWLHSRGVPRPWVPPREFAMRYLDADGEASIEEELRSLAQPGGLAAEWQLSRALYAGYVEFLDEWLGQLLDGLETLLGDEAHLLIVTAAEGESLSERAETPDPAAPLDEEIVHTPLFVRLGGGEQGEREAGIVQAVDLPATLLDFYGGAAEVADGRSFLPAVRGETWSGRREAYMGAGPGLCGVRTEEYYLIRGGELPAPRLYLKPEDLWNVLDVSGQWPQFVAEGNARLDALLPGVRGAV